MKGFKNADVFVPQYSFHLGKHIIMKTVSRGFWNNKKKLGVISQVVESWHFRQKKGRRGRGEAGIAASSTAASGTASVWQGRPQHSVVPQSLRGRKTKKMVLKLLRHARQAAQPRRTA